MYLMRTSGLQNTWQKAELKASHSQTDINSRQSWILGDKRL